MLVIDAANVVGSRPDGWWRDRPKAARRLCDSLAVAVQQGWLPAPVVVVLEGAARQGAAERCGERLQVVHALDAGDDTIVAVAAVAAARGDEVTVVTADRALRERVRDVGGEVTGPGWLLLRIDYRSFLFGHV